jgi:hypothetical protein
MLTYRLASGGTPRTVSNEVRICGDTTGSLILPRRSLALCQRTERNRQDGGQFELVRGSQKVLPCLRPLEVSRPSAGHTRCALLRGDASDGCGLWTVPPAGFEPAPLPPEGSALSPELRGPRRGATPIRIPVSVALRVARVSLPAPAEPLAGQIAVTPLRARRRVPDRRRCRWPPSRIRGRERGGRGPGGRRSAPRNSRADGRWRSLHRAR